MSKLLTRKRAEETVPLEDCSGRKYGEDEREDIIRYVLEGAETQRDKSDAGNNAKIKDLQESIEYLIELVEVTEDVLKSKDAEWQERLKEMARQGCPICEGSGQVLKSKARTIGYTLADGESIDEELIPCPLCCRLEEAVASEKAEHGRLVEVARAAGKADGYRDGLEKCEQEKAELEKECLEAVEDARLAGYESGKLEIIEAIEESGLVPSERIVNSDGYYSTEEMRHNRLFDKWQALKSKYPKGGGR